MSELLRKKFNITDPDILGSWPALKRAAKAAWKLSKETGTPFYVWQDGKVVDLNPVKRKKGVKRGREKSG